MRTPVARTLRGGTALIALLALLSVPVLLAQSNMTAMLSAVGRVTVNGMGIPPSTVVMNGDRIRTSEDGGVTLSLRGSTVVIPANSDIRFRQGLLQVQSGTADVNTTRGLRAQAERCLIRPDKSHTAKFQVTRLNANIVITAERGTVIVEGTEPTILEAGTSATFRDGSAGSAPVIRKSSANSVKILAGAGVSGGATAAATAVAGSKRKTEEASPVHP